MGMIGKLLISLAMLICQVSVGAVACACPATPAPPPLATKAVCPMSMQVGCGCCASEGINAPSSWQSAPNKCQVRAKDVHPPAALKILTAEAPPAIIIPALIVLPHAPVEQTFPARHYVIRETGPPDPSLHGLRAPPSR